MRSVAESRFDLWTSAWQGVCKKQGGLNAT